MGGYSLYSMSNEGLTEELNKGKELFTNSMLKEAIITKEQHEQMKQYSVVIAKKGFFGSLWDSIFKGKDIAYYFVVKIITPNIPNLKEVEDETK